MATWTEDDGKAEQRHLLMVLVGIGLLLAAAALLYLGGIRWQWPTAQAQVLTVQLQCEMDAQGYSRSARRAPPVIIACDQVDRFRADNPHRRWTLQKRYSGQVRVEREGIVVTVEMGLGRVGSPPKVGDRFVLVQNPDLPSDVAFPDRSVGETLAGLCTGGLGVFVLALAFFWF